jgi:hypothetical protein
MVAAPVALSDLSGILGDGARRAPLWHTNPGHRISILYL